jgi:hypothetical protein
MWLIGWTLWIGCLAGLFGWMEYKKLHAPPTCADDPASCPEIPQPIFKVWIDPTAGKVVLCEQWSRGARRCGHGLSL